MTLVKRDLAIVIYAPFPYATGGRETWLARLAPLLAADHRVTVYTQAAGGAAMHDLGSIPDLRLRPIESSRIGPDPMRKVLLNIPVAMSIAGWIGRVSRALESDGFGGGVVLGLGPIIDVTPGLRLRRRYPATRVIGAVHGHMAGELGHTVPWARPVLGEMERRSLRGCDAVVANGEDTRARLRSWGIDSTLVPNGVDVAAFREWAGDLPTPLREARERGLAVLTMIATMRDIKGVRPFLAALPALRQRYGPDFRAVFVGKGDVGRYRQEAERLGVAEHVLFVGEQPDVCPWLHGADVSVNLSGGTGMAISALEALAAGTPVVAWDTPIYRQLIDPEGNGVLVTDGDVDRLEAAFERLLRDASLRASLADAGRVAAEQYDWPNAAAQLSAVLDIQYARHQR